jgi:hypothetical protein
MRLNCNIEFRGKIKFNETRKIKPFIEIFIFISNRKNVIISLSYFNYST